MIGFCSGQSFNARSMTLRMPVHVLVQRVVGRKILATLVVLQSLLLAACVTGGGATRNDSEASQFNAELGAKYLQRGELEQARQKLEKALDQDDNNALAHISFARLQQKIGELDKARIHFEKALVLQPEEAEHRNSYGVFLCETGATDSAVEQFRQAAENPYYKTPEFALDNAGLCLLDKDRLEDAEVHLRDALRRNPRFANGLLHMSDLTLQQQRLQLANAYFERFQQYGRDTPQSLLLGMEIKKASGDINSARAFASRLLNEFPKSREAGEYLLQPL